MSYDTDISTTTAFHAYCAVRTPLNGLNSTAKDARTTATQRNKYQLPSLSNKSSISTYVSSAICPINLSASTYRGSIVPVLLSHKLLPSAGSSHTRTPSPPPVYQTSPHAAQPHSLPASCAPGPLYIDRLASPETRAPLEIPTQYLTFLMFVSYT